MYTKWYTPLIHCHPHSGTVFTPHWLTAVTNKCEELRNQGKLIGRCVGHVVEVEGDQ